VDGLWLLPSTLPEIVVRKGHKNHLAVLVLVHFGVPIWWLEPYFSPGTFPTESEFLSLSLLSLYHFG